jgi:phage shock protein E
MRPDVRKILYAVIIFSLLSYGAAFSTDLLIDVRSEAEYGESHIEGSINIPVDKISSQMSKFAPDKHTPIKLYCRSGRRSKLAKGLLEKAGYTKISDLGGIDNARRLLKQDR